jgi:hypothetical protein
MSRSAAYVTWEKSARKGFAGFWFASSAIGYLCSPETPRHPYVGAGVHCVPEEGWSPAEPEHWGEAPRRCRSSLRRVDRCASPLVAERVCARVAASGRGGQRARERDHHRRALVCPRRRCEAAVAPCRVSSADHDVDHRGRHHDDDRSADHDDHRAAADDHHDCSTAASACADHHDDDRTARGRGDEQRRR